MYQLSPIALITPLRDGMNLVAKEYLASKPDSSGVLILSEVAGAARELGEALLINPNHPTEIVSAIEQALGMPLEEQVRRNRPMQERLRAYDARRWASHFLASLDKVKVQQGRLATRHLTATLGEGLTQAYRRSAVRLILLDYDGTLVPFAAQPHLAFPDSEVMALLDVLTRVPGNEVFLISGRDRRTLDGWFGGVRLNLIAEHGAWVRRHGGDWRLSKPLASSWKERLMPILQTYADQLAGALLEEKEFSLAFHYRRCDAELGMQRAKELVHELTQFTANLDVQVLEGKKVVELRNAGINKGVAAAQVAAELRPDFVLAIGDDETDEDLFRGLPTGAFSIRVGSALSNASFSLNDHLDVRRLLGNLLVGAGSRPPT